jgi:hypothetical protein
LAPSLARLTHPLPQHTLPFTEQAVPASRFVVPHAWFVQVAMVQAVAGQSAGVLHPATHAPLPSQTLPMLSSHAVNCAAFVCVQQPPMQARVTHFVVVPGNRSTWCTAAHRSRTSRSPWSSPWSRPTAPRSNDRER